MDDDLNTPDALAAIFDLVKDINTLSDASDKATLETAAKTFDELTGVLGLLYNRKKTDSIPAEVTALVEERAAAKKAKDWGRADAIRAQLTEMAGALPTPHRPENCKTVTDNRRRGGLAQLRVCRRLCGLPLPYLYGYDETTNKTEYSLWVVLALALALRLALALVTEGYPYDMSCFVAWGDKLAAQGPAAFYSEGYFADYPRLPLGAGAGGGGARRAWHRV